MMRAVTNEIKAVKPLVVNALLPSGMGLSDRLFGKCFRIVRLAERAGYTWLCISKISTDLESIRKQKLKPRNSRNFTKGFGFHAQIDGPG
jgi:hypothetical protein